MNIKNVLHAALTNPRALIKSQNIFLLSHMRGNTSLLSHLIGSHPEVEGYYEMHIGYYSWKSLYRQKLVYLDAHKFNATSNYLFDKVLHGDHFIAEDILKAESTSVLMMIREPLQTVRSVVTLYRRVEPDHEYCQVEHAVDYYKIRLNELLELARMLDQRFILIDSDDVKFNTEQTLQNIAEWVGLSSPIPTTYKKFENTGKTSYGDSSNKMMKGEIDKTISDYSDIVISKEDEKALVQLYESAMSKIKQYAVTR